MLREAFGAIIASRIGKELAALLSILLDPIRQQKSWQ